MIYIPKCIRWPFSLIIKWLFSGAQKKIETAKFDRSFKRLTNESLAMNVLQNMCTLLGLITQD